MSLFPHTMQLSEMETTDIQPCVTFKALNQGLFGGASALELNNIAELDVPEPDFLVVFRARLKQPRWVAPQTVHHFFAICCSSS
jgi:hypothetical protein